MIIPVQTSEWPLVMGLVGLQRILGHRITLTADGMAVESAAWHELPQAYFRYLLDEHSIVRRDRRRFEESLQFADSDPNRTLRLVRRHIAEQYQKLERQVPDSPVTQALAELRAESSQPLPSGALAAVQSYSDRYCQILAGTPEEADLTLNYVKAAVLSPLYGQTSFLNVSKHGLSLADQEALVFRDYVQPVLWEEELRQHLQGDDAQAWHDFVAEHKTYPLCRTLRRLTRRSKTMDTVRTKAEAAPHCALLPGHFGSEAFEEKHFVPWGAALSHAHNYTWGLDASSAPRLSALARLLLFLAAAGATWYPRRRNLEGRGEYRTCAGFVTFAAPFAAVYAANEQLRQGKGQRQSLDEIAADLCRTAAQAAGQAAAPWLLMELSSDYGSRQVRLDTYTVDENTARYFLTPTNYLAALNVWDEREAFTRSALRGILPQRELIGYAWTAASRGLAGESVRLAAREYARLAGYTRGAVCMEGADNTVDQAYEEGMRLRAYFVDGPELRLARAGGTHVFGGRRKVTAVAYRLLNSIRADNRQAFLDAVFRLYIAADQDIPPLFLDAVRESVQFTATATAFVGGLLSADTADTTRREAGA